MQGNNQNRTEPHIPRELIEAMRGESMSWLAHLSYDTLFWLHSKDTSTSLLALGQEESLTVSAEHKPFSKVDAFIKDHWTFSCLSYDLKNAVENLTSKTENPIGLPDLLMIRPKWVLKLHGGLITVCKQPVDESAIRWEQHPTTSNHADKELFPRVSKEQYLAHLDQTLKHIHRGDIYEINYCQEYFTESAKIDPVHVFTRLTRLAKAPHSAYVRWKNKHIICASPERFFKKKGSAIISQPIKGTAPRFANKEQDLEASQALLASEKERSENVMITDLVRNDISRISKKGSVGVDELFGIYSFPTVHQMISTIRGQVKENCRWEEIFGALFPMGSMTGAPKVSAMQIIDTLEAHRRGMYSGSIGFIDPKGDADFNVVIRTLLYNADNGYLSASAGGAITSASIPQKEYEESLLKLQVLFKALQQQTPVLDPPLS